MFFGNKRISVHLIRGVLGLAALYGSLSLMKTSLWPALILLLIAVLLWKGCPLCWTLGLIETIAMAIHRRNERRSTQDWHTHLTEDLRGGTPVLQS